MKILRMISLTYCDTWVTKTDDSIEWCDKEELIVTLAKSHSDDIEVKEISAFDLENTEYLHYFNMIWNDDGASGELVAAFDSLFNLGDWMR